MSRPIRLNIDVTKLNKDWFYKGQKGTYVSLAIWPNRNGPDQFGNDVGVQQSPPKDFPNDTPKNYVGNGVYFGQPVMEGQHAEENRQHWKEAKAAPRQDVAKPNDERLPF